MSLAQEFKQFINQGNAMDLAVGVIIGGAFGKIVNSLVADILMPPLGLLLGGVDFTKMQTVLGEGDKAPIVKYGTFIQNCVDFLVIALAIFLVVRTMNRMRAKADAKSA